MNLRKMDKKTSLLFFTYMSVLVLIRLIHITDLHGPMIFYDEIGYWGHAANMAGLSWTKAEPAWYSYGYSLLLVPLFSITHDMAKLYQYSIIINILLSIMGFCVSIEIIKFIYPKGEPAFRVTLAFLSTCYSSYIFQSQIGWAETFIYVWFSIVLLSCIYFLRTRNIMSLILFSFNVSFLYIIHNRSLPIMIAFFILLLILLWLNQISYKSILLAALILLIIMIINHYMKIWLSQLMWGEANAFIGNDFRSNILKLARLDIFELFSNVFLSMIGKLWYLFASTFLFAFWGWIYLFKEVIKGYKSKIWDNRNYFCLFCLLCVLGVFAVTTLSMLPSKERIDFLFYGRYSDMIVSILIIFGGIYLKENGKLSHVYIEKDIALFMLIITGLIVNYWSGPLIGKSGFNVVCVPGIMFEEKLSNAINLTFALNSTFISVLMAYFIFLLYALNLKPRFHNLTQWLKICGSVGICVMFFMVSENAYSSCLVEQQNKIRQNSEIYDFLNNYKDVPVFMDEGIINPMSAQSRKYIDEERRLGVRAQATESLIEYTLPKKSVDDCILLMLPNNRENSGNHIFNDWKVLIKSRSGYNVSIKGEKLIERVKKDGYPIYAKSKILEFPWIKVKAREQEILINNRETAKVNIQFECEGQILFINKHKYALAYHIYDGDGRLKLWDGKRTTVSSVYDGLEKTIVIDEALLRQPGHYIVKMDMVEEGKQWLSNCGVELPEIHVFVK